MEKWQCIIFIGVYTREVVNISNGAVLTSFVGRKKYLYSKFYEYFTRSCITSNLHVR